MKLEPRVSTASVATVPSAVSTPTTVGRVGRLSQQPDSTIAATGVGLVVAAVAAAGVAFHGYFDFGLWAPIALGAIVALVVVLLAMRPGARIPGVGRGAGAALVCLLGLSVASVLWAQSKESVWTDSGRLALYVAAFGIVLLLRPRAALGRWMTTILGLPALGASVWLAGRMLAGGAGSAFLQHRLNWPIGYINGTAGLLSIGLWPWLALAEDGRTRGTRTVAIACATLIASTLVLTQSRAVLPAAVISAAVVLLAGGSRVRRLINLLIVGAATGLTLPWTLPIYSQNLAIPGAAPGSHTLRIGGAAILVAALLAAAARMLLSAGMARIPEPRRATTERRVFRSLLGAIVAAVLVGGIVGAPWISRQYTAFTSLRVNQSASVRFVDAGGFRYDLWRVAWREFTSHPFGGLGAGNYDTVYYQLRRNPEYVQQPHSLELQMAAELGAPGLLALLAFCGVTLWAGVRRRGRSQFVTVGALGMFTAWLTATSVDWLYDIPSLTLMAIISAALLLGGPESAPVSSPNVRRWRFATFAVLAASVLAATGIARQYAATRYASAGEESLQSGRTPALALEPLRQAAQLDPYSLPILYDLAATYAQMHDYPRARLTLLLAVSREPSNYVPHALLGDLAMRHGDPVAATNEYRRALALNPRDPQLQQSLLTVPHT